MEETFEERTTRNQDRHQELSKNLEDKCFDRLNEHYMTQVPLLHVFKVSLSEFAESDPNGFKAFKKHMINAHVVSSADVRAYDIMRWFKKDLPQNVKLSLNDVSRYYHKEAVLRSELKHAEGRCDGDHLKNDEEWAAELGVGEPFGLEQGDPIQNGVTDYVTRFSGRLQIKHLIASFETREVFLEHADRTDRYPAKADHHRDGDVTSVDTLVVEWSKSARDYFKNDGRDGVETLSNAEQSLLDKTLLAMLTYEHAILLRTNKLLRMQVDILHLMNERLSLPSAETVADTAARDEKTTALDFEIEQVTRAYEEVARSVI